jgi:hypothetical protein
MKFSRHIAMQGRLATVLVPKKNTLHRGRGDCHGRAKMLLSLQLESATAVS